MNKSEAIKMIMEQIKPDKFTHKLVNCIIENTLDILEEKEMIDYSKYEEPKKETESNIDAGEIAKLIECGCSEIIIKGILKRNQLTEEEKENVKGTVEFRL